MPALITSGTQTAVIDTEHTLATDTSGKTYVLVVDTANMVNGDVLELRIYTEILSGDAEQIAYFETYADIQGQPNKYSIPVPANNAIQTTLKQVAGTGRTYKWALLSL